jgi:hypothetical protein
MSLAIEAFIVNVREFCAWVESDKHDLLPARQHLLALMQGIPYLQASGKEKQADYPRREHAGWEADFERLSDLPLQSYRMVYAPLDLQSSDTLVNDLRDDLADIYGDLWHGLRALEGGDGAYAVNHWRSSYFYHWGHHAAAAIYAIDEFYQASVDWKSP